MYVQYVQADFKYLLYIPIAHLHNIDTCTLEYVLGQLCTVNISQLNNKLIIAWPKDLKK